MYETACEMMSHPSDLLQDILLDSIVLDKSRLTEENDLFFGGGGV